MIRDISSVSHEPEPASADGHGRRINYLRLSITDTCNFRCVYCMPEDTPFKPVSELMADDEIVRLAACFARLGFEKFRLTGGEPTLRPGVAGIVRQLRALPGVREVTMTTNGTRLADLARPLADAGLRRINVRLDSLDPARFRELSRRDELSKVWKGILAAEAVGLAIKLNVVLVRGINDETDAVELARLTLDKPWQVRFIELMPLGGMSVFQKSKVVREAELRTRLESALGPLTSVGAGVLDGEARIFRAAQAPGTIGFISSVSRSFCCACRRARLTADGHLRLCLLHEAEVDLLTALRSGATDAAIERLIQQGLHRKPLHHALAQDNAPADRLMSQIGG